MLKIKQYQTGPLSVNTYLVCDDVSKECIIIDLGGEIDKIYKDIKEFGGDLKYILNTHGHFDHIWGEKEAQEKYNIPIYVHKDDLEMVNNLETYTKLWGFPLQRPPKAVCAFDETTNNLTIGDKKIKIFHTPGHTKGGSCFLIENNLFSGDTLFFNSIGRTDLEGGSYSELINSIKTKLLPLDENTIVYPGHGPKTTIKSEKRNFWESAYWRWSPIIAFY